MDEFRERLVDFLPRLRRFTVAIAGSLADGDDLLQMTVERALLRQATYNPAQKIDSWLFKIAQNLLIDQKRSTMRKGPHVDIDEQQALMGEDGRVRMEQRQMTRKVLQAIDCLPPDQRLLVAMVLVSGWSYKEAAAALEIPVGTVMSRLSRARQTLQADILGQGDLQ